MIFQNSFELHWLKVKSAYKTSGLLGHDEVIPFSALQWIGCCPSQGYPQHQIRRHPFYTPGWREALWEPLAQGMQEWRSGESACLPLLWPGFDSRTRRHMWVEFVIGSRPCSEGFSPPGFSGFPPSTKTNTPNRPFRSGNEDHRFVSFAVSVTLNK